MNKNCLWFLLMGLLIIGGLIQQGEAQQTIPGMDMESDIMGSYTAPRIQQYMERSLFSKPEKILIRSTDDKRHVTVKFRDEMNVTLDANGIPVDQSQKYLRSQQATDLFRDIYISNGKWRRMAGASESEMDRLRRTAEINLNREMANLNNYFVLTIPEGVNSENWINQLNGLPEVEVALPMPKPVPLPVPISYQYLQGYLNRADTGIAALHAWSVGDSGQNVTICDFEYSWNLSHQDLPAGISKFIPPQYSIGMGWNDYDLYNDDNHGTAVLGEMASSNNGWGTTGGSYGATLKVAPTFFKNLGGTDSVWDLGAAMTYAMTQLNRGDIFLIEQQFPGPLYLGLLGNDTGLIPIEWFPPWYDVVVTAIGNGIHIVEAAGNGYQNLDSIVYRQGNYGHWPFVPEANSGAIIVGAGAVHSAFGGTDVNRSRIAFSNYGSRLDLQGWGEQVMTTGYGTYYSSEGKNLYYKIDFSGTSSASPVVASAVALVESRFESLYGQEISPATMRSILVNTGQAQQSGTYPSSQKIGPLPDVQSAINFAANTLAGGTYTVGATGNYLNLTAVSNALKSKILTGNVIFELQADYNGMSTETLPVDFTEFTSSGGTWSVTIRPAIGVTGRQTVGKPPGYYPLVKFNGIDRITLDGRPGGVGTAIEWLFRNSRQDSLAQTILFTNGASDNMITYLQIEGEFGYLSGGTVQFSTVVDSLGNRRNTVSHCSIRERTDGGALGLPANGVYADWLTSSVPNDSNSIIANEILNWTNSGIYLNGERWVVDSNSVYQTMTQVSNLICIQINSGSGHRIGYNYMGGTAAGASGSPLTYSGAAFTGIRIWIDTMLVSSIQGNQIKNIAMVNPGAASFMGIEVNTGLVDIGTITGNMIGDPSVSGSIQISGTGVVGGINLNNIYIPTIANVYNNKISNIDQIGLTGGQMRGISLMNIKTQNVERNEVSNVGPVSTTAGNTVYGIYIQQTTFAPETTKIINNMICLGVGQTNGGNYIGIYDAGPSPNQLLVHHNSVYIGGISNAIDTTYAFRCDGISMVNIFNNIFANGRSSGSGRHFAIGSTMHPIGFLPGSCDYNIFYNLDSTKLTRWAMGPGATIDSTISFWRVVSLCDMNSINADPVYSNISLADLHMNPAIYSPADNAGFSLATVGVDFDGQTRGSPPDIGADEYTINAPQAFALLLPGNGSLSQPLSGTLSWQKSPAAGQYDVYLDTLSPPTIIVNSGKADTFYAYSGLDSNHIYYWAVTGKNSSGNTVGTGAPWYFQTYSAGQTIVSISMNDGWNMASVPLIVNDYTKSALFPNAVSDAFIYSGSYVARDTLENGVGCWLKFSGSQMANIAGSPDDEDTIDVNSGWNMIGSISSVVLTDSIENIPGDMVLSGYFGYNGGYVEVDSIVPGYAYWIKSDKEGQLRLKKHASAIASSNTGRIDNIFEKLGSLSFVNSSGNKRTLYFGNTGNNNSERITYDLPPVPPKGAFDVRYATGTYVESYVSQGDKEVPVLISSEIYPIVINWSIPAGVENGAFLSVDDNMIRLYGNGDYIIKEGNASVKLILISNEGSGIPSDFSLKQNYPNPFNSSTMIYYQSPVGSEISLKIYDILGQEVAILAEGYQKEGYHTVSWDAANNPSGVYYCRMITSGFSQTNKIILIR